jgi:hypothetical protein
MAIIHDSFEQGSEQWIKQRLGLPGASQFHRIITGARGELSKQAPKYAAALVAETLLGRPLESANLTTWAMQRGTELEPLARAQYAADNQVEVRQVGLVTTDCGRVGCSPDGLVVGTRGGLEIKCLFAEHHMSILFDGPGEEFKQQVQASLAICELEWWDLYCFHPDLPPVTIRTYRDEPYIEKMRVALAAFLEMRDAMLAKARAIAWTPRPRVADFAGIKTAA